MKKHFYAIILPSLFLILFIFLFVSGCSDDPSSPTNEIPKDAFTVGVEGGIVGDENFNIAIPAGTFNGNYDISLIKITDDGAFGDNTVTLAYKLTGIPNNFSKPIKVISKYTGQLRENSFLSVGKKIYDPINQDSVIFYDLLPAYDSSGNLISEISVDTSTSSLPKISHNKNLNNFQLDRFLKFVTNLKYSVTPHFRFDYQNDTEVDMLQVATIFENAFEVVYNGLFHYFELNYDNWNHPPLKVKFIKMQKVITDDQDRHDQTFNVNIDMLKNKQFNEVQFELAKRLFLPRSSINSNTFWGDFPIYFWLEDLLSDVQSDFPKADGYNFLDYGMSPFINFKPSIETYLIDKIRHGVAMSVFLKYLYEFQNYSVTNMRLFMGSGKNSELMNLIVQWWPDFFKKYLTNELYKLPDDYFINRAHAEWNISTAADTLKKFATAEIGKYQDLSAKMFKINFNYPDLDNTQNIKFKMIGPDNNKDLSLILYSIKNNKLEFIETTQSAEYIIENPKSYIENGASGFLAVLVNSNITQDDLLGQSSIDLEVRVTPKQDPGQGLLSYKKAYFGCQIYGKFENKWADGSLHYFEQEYGTYTWYFDGVFSGNYYSGNWSVNDTSEATLEIGLNETLDTIETFIYNKLTHYTISHVVEEKIIGTNIPINLNVDAFYEINGAEVCNSITSYLHSESFDGNSIRLYQFGCNDASRIFIRFYKE